MHFNVLYFQLPYLSITNAYIISVGIKSANPTNNGNRQKWFVRQSFIGHGCCMQGLSALLEKTFGNHVST